MNTFNTASDFNASGNPHAWVAPACNPKLAIALEKLIAESHIDLITSDKALLPHDLHGNDEEADGRGGAYRDPSEWDGSFGLQKGMKKVRLASGKTVLADFVFVGIGNRSNVELVEKADEGALVDGQVWVDDYLRVSTGVVTELFTRPFAGLPPTWKSYLLCYAFQSLRLSSFSNQPCLSSPCASSP